MVDDAIVVIENTHRMLHEHPNLSTPKAAKFAAGEVFVPVLAGTLTTVAPFVPLLFWPGIVGSFMYYLPVTLDYHADVVAGRGLHHEPGVCRELHAARRAFQADEHSRPSSPAASCIAMGVLAADCRYRLRGAARPSWAT
ncbi:MAG: efflux RND transporter permease subunit [Hymenobacter sp.]